ncbi:histidine--tRNA ligase [Cyclobacterium plantarum]|uniref:Histidine--tRNA ligase n=1 Tax=Cyclobacterium plantarum TaxID=2716263 RepID=A0ABX0H6M1_9BACT|nr:histidine--tRNA ligase [Cyclobacterium plantarum]NHE55882.1 histidine--tRNA ligase [Cyclobacterium plantarum]
MSKQKPSIPKGMRDFDPAEMARRNYIFDTIKEVFKLFGYQQLETPAMENLSTLTGKYGEEGDQLLFKVLNSGEFLKKVTKDDFNDGERNVLPKIAEKGLRYDLTVPFARYVVMHQNEITYPFKRFQMQPVWRADRPQKGRYREFYQCDADVVGTDSLICEAEILVMIKQVFAKFGLKDYAIKINNRKILSGMAEVIGETGKEGDLCVAIDKLDKIGWEKVSEELLQRGFSGEAVAALSPVLETNHINNFERLQFFREYLTQSSSGRKGLEEIEEVLAFLAMLGGNEDHVVFDPVLARGLSYYTGAIFEVKVGGVQIGAVSGGGRYDNLTGVFGLPGISGVGFSFGVDRLYDVLDALDMFPVQQKESTQVMLACFGEKERNKGLKILAMLREAGIAAEIYPDLVKIKKQFNYADKKNIPFVAILGAEELSNETISLKNMKTGKQETLSVERVISEVKNPTME